MELNPDFYRTATPLGWDANSLQVYPHQKLKSVVPIYTPEWREVL